MMEGLHDGINLDKVIAELEAEFNIRVDEDVIGYIGRLNIDMHVNGRINVPVSDGNWRIVSDVVSSIKRLRAHLKQLQACAEDSSEIKPTTLGRKHSLFRRNIAWELVESAGFPSFAGSVDQGLSLPVLDDALESLEIDGARLLASSQKLMSGAAKTHFGYQNFIDSCTTIWMMMPNSTTDSRGCYRSAGKTYDGPFVRLVELLEGALHPSFRVNDRAKIAGRVFDYFESEDSVRKIAD